MMFEGEKNETNRKDSQNTSLILRTETFTLSEMMMTSRHTHKHTLTQCHSSCLCSLRDLWVFMSFNPSTHTHTHEGKFRRVCVAWAEATRTHRPFTVGTHTHTHCVRRATGFSCKWHLSETVWERHEEPLGQHSLHTLTEMFVW